MPCSNLRKSNYSKNFRGNKSCNLHKIYCVKRAEAEAETETETETEAEAEAVAEAEAKADAEAGADRRRMQKWRRKQMQK